MSRGMSPIDLRALLDESLPLATDADTETPSPHSLFTPTNHRLALDPEVTVVRGGRGVGKTFWFRSLLDDDLRRIAAEEYEIGRLTRISATAGYGAALKPKLYPGPSAMHQLLESGAHPADLWNSVLLVALDVPELRELPTWEERVQWTRENPDARDAAVAHADEAARKDGVTRLVLFDALDHLHRERAQADRLVSGLLRLALEMRLSTRNLRFKVFIRPDMFESGGRHFPDASKLSTNAADLTWSTTNLYGLFFHYLGNRGSADRSADFRAQRAGWRNETADRYLPPAGLLVDAEIQKGEFTRIAGPYMGANFRKGHTYTWLPNHLMDGTEQVSPRSFLSALRRAVNVTNDEYANHDHAVHYEGIRQGVQAASQTRVLEIREDLPWVRTAVAPLEGQQVPIEQSDVIAHWEAGELSQKLEREARRGDVDDKRVRTGPRNPDDYPDLIGELIELGVMRRRKDGRLDLPDVYRIAFSIGRKGGVPKVKAP
ncbi:hypothetical protein ACIRPH_20890 [Nocardiopsis sp. NPDC101807]|uniref:hypothetical protein n=1 Tax=Nocardiopsis sp. NPDC101807 TaxID=3364339 RepID=UPI00381DFEA4